VAALTAKRCHRAGSEPHFSCSRLALWRSSARRRREAPSSDMQNLHCSRRLAHISSAVPGGHGMMSGGVYGAGGQ
jgi:hypothetical protein